MQGDLLADDFERLLNSRHSCRAFLPDPVPPAVIHRLLAMAQRAPSWCNVQPWGVTIVGGATMASLREAFATTGTANPAPDIAFPSSYHGMYAERRRECGLALYRSVGIARDDRKAAARQTARNFTFFDAPHVAIVTAPLELGPYALVDCGGYISMFLMAAESLGIGAIAQAALASRADVIHEILAIPSHLAIVCGVSFGWKDVANPVNIFRTSRVVYHADFKD